MHRNNFGCKVARLDCDEGGDWGDIKCHLISQVSALQSNNKVVSTEAL